MRIIIFSLFFISLNAFGLEAVVTVLEAPLFREPNLDAPVVQYYRKGDVIKIHPSVANDRSLEQFAPSPEKRAELKKQLQERAEYKDDPLFKGEEESTYFLEDQFIPTLDRQGKTAYILSEHIFVYFNDSREFSQKITSHDPTDYRLEEPLPPNYPLRSISGYRGQVILGITQPYYESYPYKDKAATKGYRSPVDASVTLLKLAPGDYHERLFIGGTMSFRQYQNSFTFFGRSSEETGYKFGLGPTISYDAFKGEKNRINLSGTVMVNLLDRLEIEQEAQGLQDNRLYGAFSVAPRINLQYHRKKIFTDTDFVLGTSMEVGLPVTYQAKNAGKQTSWWRHIGNDKFTTRTTFSLGGYVGIQSAY